MSLPCPSSFPTILLFLFWFTSTAAGGVVGVDYGRVADNLMPPEKVVALLKANAITAVSIYDADPTVLRAFSGTGITVSVTLPNDRLPQAAASPAFAAEWVRANVAAHLPSTRITAVAVGNEIFHCCPGLTPSLVPAMRNVAGALAAQGLAGAVKVSTPVAFDAVTRSFPPSDGDFREDLKPVMREMMELLRRTGSYLMVNIFTYLAYVGDANVPLDYALGKAHKAVVDPKTGRSYYSLLDAQLDAVYSAMNRLGYGGAGRGANGKKWVEVKETGWPHPPGRASPAVRAAAYDGNEANASVAGRRPAVTMENAAAHNGGLIRRMLAGRTGTPLRPEADMDVYVFALFDEDLKPGDPTERHYGLFYPDGRKVYGFSFRPAGGGVVAEGSVGARRLQAAREKKADCGGAIQPGAAACFQPNTVEAHGRRPEACDFKGAAKIVTQPPGTLLCNCCRVTWCKANPRVGNVRLQEALNWACGEGNADCGPISPDGPCFMPNTLMAHATYAFNSYYQKHNREPGACDFKGAASIVSKRPQLGNCKLPP